MILNDTDHLNRIMDHDMLNGHTIWTDPDDNDYLNEITDPNQPNGMNIWTDTTVMTNPTESSTTQAQTTQNTPL